MTDEEVEVVARALAADMGRQDDGEAFLLASDLRLEWIDQSDVDFGLLARAAITALDAFRKEKV